MYIGQRLDLNRTMGLSRSKRQPSLVCGSWVQFCLSLPERAHKRKSHHDFLCAQDELLEKGSDHLAKSRRR